MLIYSYDYRLVLASVVISLMAAFTGMTLTRGLSHLPEWLRHLRIAMAAIALGGGIWSMHFVAMLAMRFDTMVYYQALPTVASVLIAILLAGLALILMHFGPRTAQRMALAGAILGIGIVAMHYVGLSAIEGCDTVYGIAGIVLAGLLAVGLCILAIRTAYHRRRGRDLLMATGVFGLSVVIVHFTAMAWTDFIAMDIGGMAGPAMAREQLALVVLISGFVISGAFLLSSASFLSGAPAAPTAAADPAVPDNSDVPDAPDPPPAPLAAALRVPYEREGVTHFLPAAKVAALRAEGHYTIAYTADGQVFCPWSISEAEQRLTDGPFFRSHRSYLVNITHVSAFERRKDNGLCRFDGTPDLDHVPVSRAKVSGMRAALGL